jgi:ribosomal protein L2
LTELLRSTGGRNNGGYLTSCGAAAGAHYRVIDFKRDKRDIPVKVR